MKIELKVKHTFPLIIILGVLSIICMFTNSLSVGLFFIISCLFIIIIQILYWFILWLLGEDDWMK